MLVLEVELKADDSVRSLRQLVPLRVHENEAEVNKRCDEVGKVLLRILPSLQLDLVTVLIN